MEADIVAQLLGDASVILVLVWRLMRADDMIDALLDDQREQDESDE